MSNKFIIIKSVLLILLVCTISAYAEEEDDNDKIEMLDNSNIIGGSKCDGKDPNGGGVLIPEDWIKRCKLCSEDGELEFDRDCLQRLAYDRQYQFDQYNQQIDSAVKQYTKDDLKEALNGLINAGKNARVSKQQAGFDDLLQKAGLQLLNNDQDLANDLNLKSNPLDTGNSKSKAKECVEGQGDDSGRCSLEANNRVAANGTQLLNKLLATKSMISRTEIINSLTDYILPSTEVNKNEKTLILPSDEDAEEAAKLEKEKANE